MDKKVRIYSTPTCPYCHKAKAYLDQKGITYEDIDVSVNSEKAKGMVNLSGQMSVPVLDIDGEIIVGFDREKIEKAIEL